MFTDYAEFLETFKFNSRMEQFRLVNHVIFLPNIINPNVIHDSLLKENLVDKYINAYFAIPKDKPLFFCIPDYTNKHPVFSLYRIEQSNLSTAINAFIDDQIEIIKKNDKQVRLGMGVELETLFKHLFADDSFSSHFISALQNSNFDRDFRIDYSIRKDDLIRPKSSYFLNLNIRFNDEHTSFLKDIFKIESSGELLYRGYILFSSDLTILNYELDLFSSDNLYTSHLHLKYAHNNQHNKTTFISDVKKNAYSLDDTVKFYDHYLLSEYKQLLYVLLKFHNPKKTQYIEAFPELYVPSVYDFSTICYDEWDMRFLIQKMIDI